MKAVSMARLGGVTAFLLLALYFVPLTGVGMLQPLANSLGLGMNVVSIGEALFVALPALGIWILCGRKMRKGNPATELAWAGLAYALALFLSCSFVRSNDVVAHDCVGILAAVSIGVFAAALCGNVRTLALMVGFFAILAGGAAVYLRLTGYGVSMWGGLGRAEGLFASPQQLATLMVCALPMLFAVAMTEQRFDISAIASIGCAIAFAALVLTWSRGGVFAVGVAGAWLVYRKTGKGVAVAACVAVMLGVCLVVVAQRGGGAPVLKGIETSLAQRETSSRVAISAWMAHPLVGGGAGISSSSTSIGEPQVANAHPGYDGSSKPESVPMLFLMELGVVGLVLYAGVWNGFVRTLRRGSSAPLAPAIESAWLALLVMGLTSVTFGDAGNPVGNVMLGLLIGGSVLAYAVPVRAAEAVATAASEVEGLAPAV